MARCDVIQSQHLDVEKVITENGATGEIKRLQDLHVGQFGVFLCRAVRRRESGVLLSPPKSVALPNWLFFSVDFFKIHGFLIVFEVSPVRSGAVPLPTSIPADG